MPLYESVYIARQDVSSQQVEGLTENFTSILENNGGRIAKSEYWGLRNLAYKIKKNRKGHYVLMHIDAPAAAIHELERNMRINEDIVRYLTTRVDEIEEGPSIVMLSKGRSDDRRGDRDSRGPREDRESRGPRSESRSSGSDSKDNAGEKS
jgi:small subunit ribosomal protein S6